MTEDGKRKKVLCPVSGKDGKTYWLRMGSAFVNKDGSFNVYLDALPLNGKLQLRDWDDQPGWERRDRDVGGSGHGAIDRDAPSPLMSVPMSMPVQMPIPRLAAEGGRATEDLPF
jgi:hypothetical protein